ncbi:MAG: phosphoglycerate dehydrogenase [Burkholderiales bacterium]
MAKILVSTSSFDVKNSKQLGILEKSGFEIVLNPHGRRLTESEVMELLHGDVVGMIAGVEPLTRKVLEASKNLKVISRCGNGLDSVDVDAANELGILVKITPDAPVVAAAELTMGLILDLLRKISLADRNIRNGKWKPLMGNLLASQTVGVIGYGRIGKKVCQFLRAFGSRVIVYDKREVSLEAGLTFYSMDEVIARADVITLHVNYEPSTHHLINNARLARMKPGALLINPSRGGLVDEAALFSALQSGHLGGAALDTFEEEPYKGPLISLPQVVLTAHMGSYAKEARIQMEQEAADNLVKGLAIQGIPVPA